MNQETSETLSANRDDLHNTELEITECIYFLSNCSWCTTLNFFFFDGGKIFEGAWVP